MLGPLLLICIHLRETMIQGERHTCINRQVRFTGFLLKYWHILGGCSQELGTTGFPCRWQELHHLNHYCWLPGSALAGSQEPELSTKPGTTIQDAGMLTSGLTDSKARPGPLTFCFLSHILCLFGVKSAWLLIPNLCRQL